MITNEEKSQDGSTIHEIDIAIVGGGIAGLYCATKITSLRSGTIRVYESTDELGGRIQTRYFPNKLELKNEVSSDHLDFSISSERKKYKFDSRFDREFDAEFGPMRIEPDQQPLLKELLQSIGIQEKSKSNRAPYLDEFPAYSSPVDIREPTYHLEGEEREQQTPFDLLKLAFVRMLGRLVVAYPQVSSGKKSRERQSLADCLERGQRALTLSIATRQPEWKGSFQRWINQLNEQDYQNFREYAELEYDSGDRVPLWQMGFWNLMTDVLSHNAVMKLRDQGSFYHLLSENPNAVEWLIFWLRGLKTSARLQGIRGGMSSIVERMIDKVKKLHADDVIVVNHKLIKIEPYSDGRVLLTFRVGSEQNTKFVICRHVIVAIPSSPLKKVIDRSEMWIPPSIVTHLTRSVGFPMTKVFVIVRRRWWEDEQQANLYAGRVPTRELHYWKSRDPDSERGMIMAYTDRPGTNFWANYVPAPGEQIKPEWEPIHDEIFENQIINQNINEADSAPKLGLIQTRRLIYKMIQYLREIGIGSLRTGDIEHYGIMDWGREPYGAANHNWLPETKSWIALREISSFSLHREDLRQSDFGNIHICGEAYSDYHGFIEGSLRSAAHVLHRIDPEHHSTPTPWLCPGSAHCQCAQDASREK